MSELVLDSGYFDAELNENGEPDRTYFAEDLNKFLEGLVSQNGIYFKKSTSCQVVKGDGLNVIVKAGKGQVNYHWFKVPEDTKFTLTAADVIQDRIDRIIVRWSKSDRNCVLTVLEGALSSSPVAPTLTRTEDIYEISLAQVYIKKNATSISPSNITDERGFSDRCGWVTGLIDQLDTSELFKQFETAQVEFINEKTAEYNSWFSEVQQQATNNNDEFNTWFTNVQEQVNATNVYREYEVYYKTTKANQTEIPLSSSLNYVHNSLDIINVYVGRERYTKDSDYTINSNGTAIVLNTALPTIGTLVQIVNKKSISGEIAESVLTQVENLQSQVDELELSNNLNYTATGTDDNIAISNIVKNFLDGTGDYSSVKDNASMSLYVHGEININNLIESQMAFDFHSSVSSKRIVYVDFGNATIIFNQSDILINIGIPEASAINTAVIFGSNNGNVVISKANIYLGEGTNVGNLYAFHGGIVRDCKVLIRGPHNYCYGVYNCQEVSNSEININGATTMYGVYACTRVQFNEVTSSGSAVYMSAGLLIGNVLNSINENEINTAVLDIGNSISTGV